MYDFNEVIDRKGTSSTKWSAATLEETFKNKEALPLWIADMDFKAAPAVLEEVQKVVDHGIFGYSTAEKANAAFIGWTEKRHGWRVKEEWISNTPGIVFALNVAVQTFTKPGDSVIIQRPVYYPFTEAIENNGRKVSSNSLMIEDGTVSIDFEDFEKRAQDPNTTLFILCSPHNPLSKIYSKEELTRMLDICRENNVMVVSDEVHGDLIMPGQDFTSVGALGEEYLENIMICMAPSKTFNLAGIQWSAIVIPNDERRHHYQRSLEQLGSSVINPLSFAAVIGAYQGSEEWLDDLIDYVYNNFKYLKEKLETNIEGVKVFDLEATYLAYVDFTELGFSVAELEEKFFKEAGVGLDGGHWFGPEGEGCMRINLATSRAILEEAVSRIIEVCN
jgi:cystathionine beta-lyase